MNTTRTLPRVRPHVRRDLPSKSSIGVLIVCAVLDSVTACLRSLNAVAAQIRLPEPRRNHGYTGEYSGIKPYDQMTPAQHDEASELWMP